MSVQGRQCDVVKVDEPYSRDPAAELKLRPVLLQDGEVCITARTIEPA